MNKAPDFKRHSIRRRVLEHSDSKASSESSVPDPTPTSTVPSSSSATSRTQSVHTAQPAIKLKNRSFRHERSLSAQSYPGDEFQESVSQHRMVIAIDYGTTFTGIGYAFPERGSTGLEHIRVISNWGSNMTNDIKIPSVISYSECTEDNEQMFGASLSPKAIAMVNTKLELDAQDTRLDELDLLIQVLDGMENLSFDHVKASRGYPGYTWKQPEDIVTDYLEKAFEHFWASTEYLALIRDTAPADIIITVPVNWSYRARNSTLRAIQAAGFNRAKFPRLENYIMVTEPEAAAVYTARYLQERGSRSIKKDECFIMCDAGGGTVDIVGYKVKELTPSIILEQVTMPTGAKCGSSFINNNFKSWLRKVLRQNYQRLEAKNDNDKISAHTTEGGPMRELMQAFEAHKKAFHKGSPDMHVDLPAPLHELTIQGWVDGGDLLITKNMRSFFDPHVDRIIELVQGQITQAEEKRNRVRTILLIGGFSESRYLQEELEYSMRLRKVNLVRPETSWSAVIRGAVLYGMELASRPSRQVLIPCPRSYGIKMSNPYSKRLHDDRDVFVDSVTNNIMVSDQLSWLIRKGDLLSASENREVESRLVSSFHEGMVRCFEVPIYEYPDDEDIPDRYATAHEEVNKVAVLKADFTGYPLENFKRHVNKKTGLRYYETSFTCKLKIKGMTMSGEIWWYDQKMDSVTIENIDKL